MGWVGDPFKQVNRDWQAREISEALAAQPHIERAELPHGIAYWVWVVAGTLANLVAILLAVALVVLPLAFLQWRDRIGVPTVIMTVAGLVAGFSAIVWISIRLRERRFLRPVVSLASEALLIGGTAAVLFTGL